MANIMPAYHVLEAADSAVRVARALEVVLPSGALGPDFSLVHPDEYRTRSHTRLQRVYATVLHSADWLTLRSETTAPLDRAWLLSCGFNSIGADFMGAIPAFAALRLPAAEYAVAVRHHFAELQPVAAGISVCGCGRHMGARGDALHYLACKGGETGNWFSRFHDSIERQVARMMQEVYLGRGRVQTQDYTGRRVYSPSYVPDITVEDHDDRGSTLVVEVSVFRPTASRHVDVACSGRASVAVEAYKRGLYGRLAPGVHWRPFILDPWGHMSPGTSRFWDDLRRERGERRGVIEEEEVPGWWASSWSGRWRQRISMAVARNVARMIIMRARVDYSGQRGAAAMAL